jgi:hypothetical protein
VRLQALAPWVEPTQASFSPCFPFHRWCRACPGAASGLGAYFGDGVATASEATSCDKPRLRQAIAAVRGVSRMGMTAVSLSGLSCPRGATNGGLLEPLFGEGDYVVDGIAPFPSDQPVWNLKSPVSLTRWLLTSYSQVELDCCLGVDSLWDVCFTDRSVEPGNAGFRSHG